MKATGAQTDLRYQPHVEIRMPGIEQMPQTLYSKLMSSRDPRNAHADFDVHISWQLPEYHPRQSGP
jgi:hypothetical protein